MISSLSISTLVSKSSRGGFLLSREKTILMHLIYSSNTKFENHPPEYHDVKFLISPSPPVVQKNGQNPDLALSSFWNHPAGSPILLSGSDILWPGNIINCYRFNVNCCSTSTSPFDTRHSISDIRPEFPCISIYPYHIISSVIRMDVPY